jgi:hypothetical protein
MKYLTWVYTGKKNPKKPMVKTIMWKTKWKAKERPKDMLPVGTKGGRKLLLVVGRYLT